MSGKIDTFSGATLAIQPPNEIVTATIANGASLSDALDLGNARLYSIQMPAAWTAAALTFQASAEGVTYADVHDTNGTELSYTVAASRFVRLTPDPWFGTRFLKIRSGTSGTPVNQGGARIITLVLRR